MTPRFHYHTLRWWVVGLLFFATVINYVDRQTLSILSTTLRQELNLTEQDYANCVSAFLVSYAVMYSVSGRVIDRIGVKLGAAACVVWWSIAAAMTGLARGPLSLAAFRFLLGVGEPGIFPAGMKACGEWFPGRLRGTAIGIFSSGSSVGAIIAAPLVVWMTANWGWRAAFVIPGIVGIVLWLPLWLALYRQPRETQITAAEAAELDDDATAPPRRSWAALLRERKVWALVLGRVGADPVWYLYLFWLPDYLQRVRHLSLAEIGLYAWIPFLFADLGAVFGGMISDRLIKRGWAAPRARFAVLCGIAAIAPLGATVGFIESTVMAMGVICVIAFLCQAWSTNMATLVPDLTARSETASVMGLLGTSGSVGGIAFSQVLGFSIGVFGYSSAFVMAAVLHPLSLLLLFVMLRPTLRAAARSGHRG
jgi:ACS family hexuronate transporter-like MFS transporter